MKSVTAVPIRFPDFYADSPEEVFIMNELNHITYNENGERKARRRA